MAAILENGRHSKLYLTNHSNLNVTISHPVLHKEPSLLCLHPCLGGQRIHWNYFLMIRNMPNVKWQPFWKMAAIQNYNLTCHSNLNVTISQIVVHIEPSYLCLHPCFGGQSIYWNSFLMTRNMPNVKWRPFWKMAAIQNYIWPAIQTLMWPYLSLYCT